MNPPSKEITITAEEVAIDKLQKKLKNKKKQSFPRRIHCFDVYQLAMKKANGNRLLLPSREFYKISGEYWKEIKKSQDRNLQNEYKKIARDAQKILDEMLNHDILVECSQCNFNYYGYYPSISNETSSQPCQSHLIAHNFAHWQQN
ncbi:1544_t:CDS:1 [Ambispora leptoticha]|uniref:1544_t:CDS:1 n=1 Tax=Ambispora leptoticha TaxID=144679 RepID=A0A9N8WS34_9GLOM|nr:1544_t:CDS:1 [Ambispora leptoticha]